MAELNKMYKGVVNSPSTYLQEPLASGGSIIYVIDGSVLGELPNIAVIGNDQTAETVLVKNIRSDGGYDVDRAVEGNAKDWPQMTTVARNFTNYDYEQIRQNFEILNTTKVDKVSGKQLSTNDYTTVEKNKLAGVQAGAQVNAVTSVNGQTGAVTTPDTTYNVATTTTNGLMSSADKTKLNGIETGAQKNIMTSADKTKLDGVETGAQKNTITSVQGRTGAVTISKSDVGLGSVNNVAITAAQVTKINELNYTRAMTEAQYNALSTAEKNRTDVWYGIYK